MSKRSSIYLPETQEIFHFKTSNLEEFNSIDDIWLKREGLVFFPFNRNNKAYFFSKESTAKPAQHFDYTQNQVVTKEEYLTSVFHGPT